MPPSSPCSVSPPRDYDSNALSRPGARAACRSRRARQTAVHVQGGLDTLLVLFATASADISPARRTCGGVRGLKVALARNGRRAERLWRQAETQLWKSARPSGHSHTPAHRSYENLLRLPWGSRTRGHRRQTAVAPAYGGELPRPFPAHFAGVARNFRPLRAAHVDCVDHVTERRTTGRSYASNHAGRGRIVQDEKRGAPTRPADGSVARAILFVQLTLSPFDTS
jgi:hypothetical protein